MTAAAQLLGESFRLLLVVGYRTCMLRAWPHAFLWARRCPPAKHPLVCRVCCVQCRCKYVVSCCCLCVLTVFVFTAINRERSQCICKHGKINHHYEINTFIWKIHPILGMFDFSISVDSWILNRKFYVLYTQKCRNLKSIKFFNFLSITCPWKLIVSEKK